MGGGGGGKGGAGAALISPPPPPSPPPRPCAGAAASGRGGDDDGDGDTALPPRPGLTSSVTRGCSLPRSWAQGRRWRLWSWPRTSSGRLCGSASPALAWNSSCTFAIFLPPPGPARLGSARPVRTAPPRLRLRLRGAGTTEERAAPGGRAGHRRRARRRAGRGAGTRMRLEGPGESGTGPRPRAAAPSQPRRPRLRGSVASGSPAQRAGAPGQKKRLVPGLLCLTRVWEVRPEIRGVTVSQVIEENGGKKDTKPKKPHGNAAPVSHGTHRIGQREKYWW